MNLLPPNATDFENKIVETSALTLDLNSDLSSLVRLNDSPSQFLASIAWQFSVDRWSTNWSDEKKKKQIKNSFKVHQHKGTNYALKTIVESFGFTLTIYEWWQESPTNEPGTLQLLIDTNDEELTQDDLTVLLQLINDAKPLSRHITNIQINASPVKATLHFLAACYTGEETTIYPELIDCILPIQPLWAFYEHQEIEIYPYQGI